MGTINVASTGTLEFNTNAAQGYGTTALTTTGTTITGSGTIIKTGTGITDWWNPGSGAAGTIVNNFTGLIDVQAGTLSDQTGSTNAWSTSAGSMTLEVDAGAYFDARTDSPVVNQLTGSGTIGSSFSSETITIGNQNGSSTFSGVITNSGVPGASANGQTIGITKNGTGTTILSGANTYTGTTTINNGTLQIANNAPFASNVVFGASNSPTLQLNTPNSSDSMTFSKTVTGGSGNNATVEKIGAGSVVVNSALNFSGNVKVTSGIMTVAGSSTYTGTTTIGNGTLRLSQIGNSNFNGNTPTVDLNAQSLTAGPITSWINNGSAGNFIGGGTVQSGGAAFNGNNVVHFNGSQFFSNATAGVPLGSSETIFYVGALDGTNNKRQVGGISNNWLMGTWNGQQDTAYGGSAFLGASTGATSTTHLYELVDSANALTLYSNGSQLGSTGTATVALQGLDVGGATGENSTGSIGEVLVFNTALSTADRQAVEAYLNYIWFGVGSPEAFQSNLLPTGTAVNITGTGTLDINGVNQTIGSLASANVLSNVTLGNATLTTGTDNTSTTFAGVISGTNGSLTKTGTGTMALTGFNTYTGTTAINGGELNVGTAQNGNVSGPQGSSGTLSFAGGTLQYSAANQFDYSYRFSTAPGQAISIDTNSQNVTFGTALTSFGGTLAKLGLGTLTLIAAATYTGTTTIGGGTLQLGDGTSGDDGDITASSAIADNSALLFNIVGIPQIYTQVISGSGTVTKIASGTVTLSGSNTYTGGTTLIAGTLNINNGSAGVNNSSAIGTGTLTIAGGTIDNTSGAPVTLGTNNAQAWNGDFSFAGSSDLNMGTGGFRMAAPANITGLPSATLTIGGVISAQRAYGIFPVP